MLDFNLKEYQKNNNNTKIKVFIEYLYLNYGVSTNSEKFDNEYFSLFTDDDLIESLKYYIAKNGITAQVTASNYVTYIRDFFKLLSEDYGIKNDTFVNVNLYEQLLLKSKGVISNLKKSDSKYIASDEQYEMLNCGINDYLDNLNTSEIFEEIVKFKNREVKKIKFYNRFVSIIAVKLIMKFALGSQTTISLELNSLDIINNIIIINGFKLQLDEELNQLLEKYLKIREYVVNLYSIEENKLFIKPNGDPYVKNRINRINYPEYSSFFIILKDKINTNAADLFTARRILEMLDKGIDVSTISKLSDKSIEKCIELQTANTSEEDVDRKLQVFLYDYILTNRKIITKKKGYLKCPFCGNDVKAISEEWVLVQFENDSIKHLACKNCRGEYGKYSI
jgi:hypothetical protein